MTKLNPPKNSNYAATVVSIENLETLSGLDNLRAVRLFGYQALVSKDTQPGTLALFFPAEAQLSEDFAKFNNLHRHGDRNADQGAQGYLEDNRRVKAIRLRGHRSDGLLIPLDSLSFVKGFNPSDLAVGDIFDELNGTEIVRKYVLPRKENLSRADAKAERSFKRIDKAFLPEHYDTDNYWRFSHLIEPETRVIVTQKLHGTSIRIGHTIVRREPTLKDRIAKFFGIKVAETEFDYVYGSRKVIKDVNNPNHDHFYSEDLWTRLGESVKDRIPQNFIIYGEVIGYTESGEPIQRGYTYDLEKGQSALYIYRVAVITNQGRLIDLSWDQTKAFCWEQGLNVVPELWRGKHGDFDVDAFVDENFTDIYSGVAVPLSDAKTVDEGVCVRAENNLTPYILKAKSPIFLAHETKMLDAEALDIEAEESVE